MFLEESFFNTVYIENNEIRRRKLWFKAFPLKLHLIEALYIVPRINITIVSCRFMESSSGEDSTASVIATTAASSAINCHVLCKQAIVAATRKRRYTYGVHLLRPLQHAKQSNFTIRNVIFFNNKKERKRTYCKQWHV